MKKNLKNFAKKIVKLIPTKLWLSYRFRSRVGYSMDWKNPTSYNQKLQWLKVYDRKPVYTEMVDKYQAKEYVSQRIGAEYIIPTLGVWDRFEEIDFDILPDQFVLKCTHDSGGLVIVRDKSKLDLEAARKKLTNALKRNPYSVDREWPYKNVKPRILAEAYMSDSLTGELRDYKFFCFNGKCKALFIASDRFTEGEETKFDFFDENFQRLPFTNGHPNSEKLPEKPLNFELMKNLAEVLSDGFPQLRVDFYEVDGKVYFGELTFYHWSGLTPFQPLEWDYKFGEWIQLPR